ncbi:hypothetical protein T12_8448 [Trichinella patagoniensis]|uniref:Uncharacterized protein n=1 Tax=Trichinella patagoniensis TaxID=990121 RepID=A0A0V0ZY66_9BILA|nr:hypothetical protein T12_8448 [Trichinella patagoniensis]
MRLSGKAFSHHIFNIIFNNYIFLRKSFYLSILSHTVYDAFLRAIWTMMDTSTQAFAERGMEEGNKYKLLHDQRIFWPNRDKTLSNIVTPVVPTHPLKRKPFYDSYEHEFFCAVGMYIEILQIASMATPRKNKDVHDKE